MRFFRAEQNRGYTLVELMVALLLTVIATAGIYKAYVSITRENEVQEQIIELQQNLRVGMQRMTKEIRMAGYDPTGSAGAIVLVTSNSSKLDFSMDLDEDGTVDPAVTYQLTGGLVERSVGGTARAIIGNVEALNFVYLDANGNVLAIPLADPTLIRTIQIAVVATSTNEDYSYTDSVSYTNLQGTELVAPQDDNMHRRVLTAEVKCRNMGI